MEDIHVYIYPSEEQNATYPAQVNLNFTRMPEDKVCNGFFNSEQLMNCAKYKVEPCLMMPECFKTCGELECWRGEEKSPFFNIVVPKNITSENAKNLCIFYNSKNITISFLGVDLHQCHDCQIYTDIYKFESSSLTLEAWEEFILSIILVFIVLGIIVIAYYNLALAIRGHAPFKVHPLLPQIMFPRGAIGLGKHNVEEE
jgi:hypothetical protein